MTVDVRLLSPGEASALTASADGVFDRPVDLGRSREFLSDPRHHLAVAFDGDLVVGAASAVHYIHPDKPPELWVNEVAVAPSHRGRGIARVLLRALFARGQEVGCGSAWVVTERSNTAAMRLYAALGGHESVEDTVLFTFSLDGGPEAASPP